MIKLSFIAPCETYHKSAYHNALVLALESLANGVYVPWGQKNRKKYLSDDQLGNPAIKSFFADLWTEERDSCALLCGSQTAMERVIDKVGPKYAALADGDREGCRKVLEAILPYEAFKEGKGLEVENGLISVCETPHWGGVAYLNSLKVGICPYCNDAPLPHNTMLQYDHYLDKGTFPYLRLNLYNLVPSCPTCNQYRKKNIPIRDFRTYPYPYRDSIDAEAKFDLDFDDLGSMKDNDLPIKSDDLRLEKRRSDSPDRSKSFLEKMGLLEDYKSSEEIIRKINDVKSDAYYLHGEVQDGYESLFGKIGKRQTYERVFHFPLERGKISRVQDLKICLDMVSIFAPELIIE